MASEGVRMRNRIVTILAAATMCGLPNIGIAQNHKKMPAPPKKAALVCPVTGEKIASAKAAAGHSTFKGKTYYFCCGMCKPKFDKNPGRYVTNAAKGKFEKM